MNHDEIVALYREFYAVPFPRSIQWYDSAPQNRNKDVMTLFPIVDSCMLRYVKDPQLSEKDRSRLRTALDSFEQALDIEDAEGKRYLAQAIALIKEVLAAQL